MPHAPKQNRTRGRALRAIAPLAAVSAIALSAPAHAAAAAGSCAGADADPANTSMVVVKRATVCLLNQQRRQHHLKKLRTNGRLSLASQRHSNDMARRKYFAHGNFVGRIKAAHYLSGSGSWSVGENIAWGSGDLATPAEIVKAWMNSPPHRHNILSGNFAEIGIGVARGAPVHPNSDGAPYATDFGRRGYPARQGLSADGRAERSARPLSFPGGRAAWRATVIARRWPRSSP